MRPPLTAEQFCRLPDIEGLRIELWEGNLVVAATAQMAWHSLVASRITAAVPEGMRSLTVVLGPHDVVIPDVVAFRQPVSDPLRSLFHPHEIKCVVEVVSPESAERDTKIKPDKYAAAGIPEFWLVTEDPDDPFEADVEIYRLNPSATYELSLKWALADLERAGYESRSADPRLGA